LEKITVKKEKIKTRRSAGVSALNVAEEIPEEKNTLAESSSKSK
jgi:hypothetical protein